MNILVISHVFDWFCFRKNFAIVNANEGVECGVFVKFPLKSTSIVSVTGRYLSIVRDYVTTLT